MAHQSNPAELNGLRNLVESMEGDMARQIADRQRNLEAWQKHLFPDGRPAPPKRTLRGRIRLRVHDVRDRLACWIAPWLDREY